MTPLPPRLEIQPATFVAGSCPDTRNPLEGVGHMLPACGARLTDDTHHRVVNALRAVEPLRVVQWTTGNVGRRSVVAVVANPALALVGCYAWSADKIGRDAGELCGMADTGIRATDDVDALLNLRPDCVVYNPKWPDVDEIVHILEAGVNIVTTASFITGRALGPSRQRVIDAARVGKARSLVRG
jgi:hypothetical protein